MSWATHDIEPYLIKLHLGGAEGKLGWRISYVAILIGSWGPDVLTKWFIYGISVFGVAVKAGDPAEAHRSWPGLGFTHSLAFGLAVGLACLLLTKHRGWALGLTIGIWAHVLSDTLDTNGVMLFFPFSLNRISFGAWAYAGSTGRYLDGAAYFSSLGFVWDGFWIALALVNWRTFTSEYFRNTVAPGDPFWQWLGGVLPSQALVVLYRGAMFYGTCRWAAWFIWAHIMNSYAVDLSWGGPYWVTPIG